MICNLLYFVSYSAANEIFSDGYRYEEETMEYQRILGNINVRLAEMADCVTEVVYGIPVRIKKE